MFNAVRWRQLARGLLAAVTMLLASAAVSQAVVSDASDYAAFERFPGASIVDFRQQASTVYTLALGRMQRAAGTVAPSQSERFQGQLRRITYAIPDGYSAEEVYAFYRNQLLAQDQRELFACQGRGCGSSNFWANDVFGNRILYGPETSQFYLASTYQSEVDGLDVNGYAALYVVTRGNRRMYAHLDFLELTPQLAAEQREGLSVTPQAAQIRLERERSVVITRLAFDDSDELINDDGIELIVDLLQRNGLMQVYIVGHLHTDDALDELQRRSLQRARQVADRVVDAGIDAGRVQAQGVGPLAPYCRPGPCGQRIELVLR